MKEPLTDDQWKVVFGHDKHMRELQSIIDKAKEIAEVSYEPYKPEFSIDQK